jgi:hypothetical protein
MTSCVHKMYERTYGQTNMKRGITLAKFNHPWNLYNMRKLRSWPTKIPNMHFIHILYLDWPWSEHVHIITISQMIDFCDSYSPFHICLTICPFAHLVYATSHLYFVAFYSYLVSWLAMIWAFAYYTNFTDGWFLQEINYPWNRYNMRMLRSWPIKIPNMNKMRQKTND